MTGTDAGLDGAQQHRMHRGVERNIFVSAVARS